MKNIINDKYILLKELGKGADSVVFRAKERDGGRLVALKFILDKCRNSLLMMNMIREVQRMRRLNEVSSMLYKAQTKWKERNEGRGLFIPDLYTIHCPIIKEIEGSLFKS